jgi:hypothetical protein
MTKDGLQMIRSVLPALLFSSAAPAFAASPVYFAHIEANKGWINRPSGEKAPDATGWIEFFLQKGEFRLQSAQIGKIESNANECTGGKDFNLRLTAGHNPLFVAKGISELKAGAVRTYFTGAVTLEPGVSVQLGKGDNYCIKDDSCDALSATGSWSTGKDGERSLTGYSLILKRGKHTQTIFKQGKYHARAAILRWVGDMDRDGQTDLIIDQNYNVNFGMSLYLSKPAQKGQQVRMVAEQNFEEC